MAAQLTRSFLLLCLLALALFLAPATGRAVTEDEARDPIAAQAEKALWWGDIDALEQLYAQARKSSVENSWNGRTPMESFRFGISSVLDYSKVDGAYFRELDELTARWAMQQPGSALRHLLHARVVLARAWHLRGNGMWKTVPEPVRNEFERLITKAETVIVKHAALLKDDPSTHVYLLMIGRPAGWPLAQVRAVAEDGLTRAPAEGLPILQEWVKTLLPKWRGNLNLVAQVISEYSPRVDEDRSDETYARLWSEVADQVEGNLFRTTRTEWPRMRTGLQRLAQRLGQPFFRNRLAHMACLAQDRATAVAAMAAINEPDLAAWESGGARGRQHYEACQLWLNSSR